MPGTSARDAVEAAAEALGGAARLQALRNLTLVGYAHYAHQQGGGNISPLPGAPQKIIAANDYRRIYDLQNGRMYHQERRNDLFPFAAYRGHDFALQRQLLDGDIAYNIDTEDRPSLAGDARDRRMWMHTNPVVAIRAALDPANTVSNRRVEDGLTLVDLRLAQGDTLTIAIRPPANLPEFVRWVGPHVNLGEITYTTTFAGYSPWNGVRLPYGVKTTIDWRNVEFLKLWIDQWMVDTEIPNLAAPPTIAAAHAAPAPAAQPIEVTPIARGVWRFTGGTAAIEFADHITLFEAAGGPDRVRQVVALARQLVPGKPVTHLIQSHHHFDHSAGLRQAVAEGLTIISRRDNGVIFEEMMARRAPNFPDDLERNRRPFTFVPVDDHLELTDARMEVDVYHVIANNHMADAVFAYIPEHRIMIEADIATAAEDLQWWGDSWLENIAYREIKVERNVPVHMRPMTYEETLQMLAPGIERVKQFCADHRAKGNFFPGCPPAVK
ncbi:MAG: MBL fold metallo-hydrolase [Vicinamibacterales bacterium]